ncbi:MAG: nucleotidyltransferase domain-containing protein [Clostridium sp.]|nr:nucleotidyltransferase domain-containing protein [Clostridium sp.]
MTLSLETISKGIRKVSEEYPIKKVTLFGSYADGSFTSESDVDLLVEFNMQNVSLFMLSGLKLGLEEIFNKNVDVLHAPLPDGVMIEIGKSLVIYES